jgi:hypothetical protein
MLNFRSKKIILPLYFCVLAALLFPALTQAEFGGSGSKAANEATEQRAVKESLRTEKKRRKLKKRLKPNKGNQQKLKHRQRTSSRINRLHSNWFAGCA